MNTSKQNLPWTCMGITAVNTLVMLVIVLQSRNGAQSQLERALGLFIYENRDTLQWQQIVGHMFVHGDLEHLFHNTIALFCMGIALEGTTGRVRFLLVYLLCGIGSGIASVWWYCYAGQLMTISVGASGAVFGMSGLLLGMVLFMRGSLNHIPLQRVLMMLAVSLASGFSGQHINNCAHLSGAVIGFLLSPAVYFSLPAGKRSCRG